MAGDITPVTESLCGRLYYPSDWKPSWLCCAAFVALFAWMVVLCTVMIVMYMLESLRDYGGVYACVCPIAAFEIVYICVCA